MFVLLDTFIFTKSKYMTFHIVILSYCVLQLQGHNRKDTHSPKLWQHTACLYSSYWIMNYNYTFHQKLKSIEQNDKTTSPLSVHGRTLLVLRLNGLLAGDDLVGPLSQTAVWSQTPGSFSQLFKTGGGGSARGGKWLRVLHCTQDKRSWSQFI